MFIKSKKIASVLGILCILTWVLALGVGTLPDRYKGYAQGNDSNATENGNTDSDVVNSDSPQTVEDKTKETTEELKEEPSTLPDKAEIDEAEIEKDTVPPEIAKISPKADATNVTNDVYVEIRFSEPIDPNTLDSNITVTDENGKVIDVDIVYDPEDSFNKVIVRPLNHLDYDTNYLVKVTTGIKDRAKPANPLAEQKNFSFTTQSFAIFISPGALGNDKTGGVKTDEELIVGFSNPVDPSSLQENKVILNKVGEMGDIEAVPYESELSDDQKLLTINPKSDLDYGACYELIVPEGVKDLDGVAMKKDSKVEFYTQSFGQPDHSITPNIVQSEEAQPDSNKNYKLTVDLRNLSQKSQNAKLYVILRGGKGAREEHGGFVLHQICEDISLEGLATGNVSFDFEKPIDIGNIIYGDIFIWNMDETYPLAEPVHFSYKITE